MPLSNAERQARHRERTKVRLARRPEDVLVAAFDRAIASTFDALRRRGAFNASDEAHRRVATHWAGMSSSEKLVVMEGAMEAAGHYAAVGMYEMLGVYTQLRASKCTEATSRSLQ